MKFYISIKIINNDNNNHILYKFLKITNKKTLCNKLPAHFIISIEDSNPKEMDLILSGWSFSSTNCFINGC